ncbi:hypothetical protein SLEP1_g45662 [Rubroshorea leprosula]|uniref:Secreted protein n=1 Tax=Rubroshorea leprosula TaxID=152421 RepID=A0AAV5LKH8_9ROSI|nr:hypothetical protein SLEP1_g45662 [Rubroshorea leprosula]
MVSTHQLQFFVFCFPILALGIGFFLLCVFLLSGSCLAPDSPLRKLAVLYNNMIQRGACNNHQQLPFIMKQSEQPHKKNTEPYKRWWSQDEA